MSNRQWKAHHEVWAVISPKYGIELYLTEREAERAKYHPDSLVTELSVMQELDENWEPMFKGEK